MRAELEKISNKPTNSFQVRIIEVDKRLNFKTAFHYHPEYELILTLTSKGRRFIGNHVNDYLAGELVFIGKNIPHCWLTEEPSNQIVVQMTEDFLGHDFLSTPECLPIRKLFDDSANGVIFHKEAVKKVSKKMKRLTVEHSFRRLMTLLEIFYELSQPQQYSFLSTDAYPTTDNAQEFRRMHALFNYIHENYTDQINLAEAASILNFTKSSLCKFIKRKTKKTFSVIVNEVRFGKATELLIETNMPIYEICFACGFNDPSYFFKKFSATFGTSPKQFRDSFN
jgi:AraC-like DNA-binding protein/quercetin dioxygenase-like cupin family protein